MLNLCRTGAPAKIRYTPEQIDDCEQRLVRMGVSLKRPIVCLHARESGYWGRTGDPTHSTKNADILSFVPAIQFLTDNGYQVVRLGDPSMRPLPELKFTFDYAHSEYKSDFLDLYLITRSVFLLCTSSGPFTVAQRLMCRCWQRTGFLDICCHFCLRTSFCLRNLNIKTTENRFHIKIYSI